MTERKEPIGIVSWFIARRYLVKHERKALASTITLISMIGVAVGVAALIIVIGVMDGAEVHLYGKMADLIPHLKVSIGPEPLKVTPDLLNHFQAPEVKDDIVFVEPVLEEKAMIQPRGGVETQKRLTALIGVEDLNTDPIYKDTIHPRGDAIRVGPDEILMGQPLADALAATSASMMRVITLGTGRKNTRIGMPAVSPLRLKGTYDTGFYIFDSQSCFISAAQFRTLFGVKDRMANYLYVRLKDPFQAEAVRTRLNLPAQYYVQTWGELNNDFFTVLKFEKLSLFIILLLIILVAAFNIIGTLVLMVIEKTREVGILRALGASEGLIMRIFLLDGISIGAAGTALGVVFGVTIGLLIPVVRISMPQAVYNFDHLPVVINPVTVATIVVSSMAISTLAALIPARQAAKLNPVEALRYD